MQVDGSLGVTAGITEMLLQSHEGVIDFLPALPNEWRDGHFEGVCARGAFELNFEWSNSKLKKVRILSKAGEMCVLNLPPSVKVRSKGQEITPLVQDGFICFATEKGNLYEISGF